MCTCPGRIFLDFSDRYFLQVGSMQVEPKITGFRQRIFVDSWRQAFSINTAIYDHLVSDLVSVTPELPNAMLRQL